MTVLLAGGNVVLQRSIAEALAASGHRVRSVCEDRAAANVAWPAEIEPCGGLSAGGDVAALDGCDAAIIVDPAVVGMPAPRAARNLTRLHTLIRHIVARRAVSHLVLVASREACRARPDASAALATELDRGFGNNWSMLQAAGVYGTGEDPISRFLILMRALPAVPVFDGTQTIRPLWHEDLARAVAARMAQGPATGERVLDVAGAEAVTSTELYERIGRLISRRPVRVPAPRTALRFPYDGASSPAAGALEGLQHLGVAPTLLDEGLRRTIVQLPELTPMQGVGRAQIKRFAVDIPRSPYSASQLMRAVRTRFRDLMPIPVGVEPAAPHDMLDEGAVITMALPGRGHVSVRCEEVGDHHAIVSTLRGHVVAGFVRFAASPIEDGVRFEVIACDTAANVLDWMSLTLGGARLQDANWIKLVRNVARMAGRDGGGTDMEMRTLTAAEKSDADQWIASVIRGRDRRDRFAHTLQ